MVAAVAVVFGVSGIIGMLSSIILLALTLYKLVHDFGRKNFASHFSTVLLLNLSIADLFTGLYFALVIAEPNRDRYDPACQVSAFLRTIGETASVVWTCCITFSSWFVTSKFSMFSNSKMLDARLKQFLIVYCVFSWGLALGVSIACYTEQLYVPDQYWCWIVNGPFRLGFFFSLLLVALVWNIMMFILLVRIKDLSRFQDISYALFWYIPGFLYVWTPTVVYSLILYIGIEPPAWLNIIRALAEPQQGTVNLIIWFFFKRFKDRAKLQHVPVPEIDSQDDEASYLLPNQDPYSVPRPRSKG